jgi:NADH-quinone oxidoreductase subunit M
LHLAVDGLSLPLVALAFLLGGVAVATSWTEIHSRVGFFHLNLLFMIAGIVGTFISLDLFLFYFFYELMLVPLYFVIGIWGAERRVHASLKFFIFTQGGGLLMLIAILGLYFAHIAAGAAASFDYKDLIGTGLSFKTGMWLMLGFLAAFAVKLPAVPLHTWLPDAHTQAPSAGSVILAGLVLKVGGYGMLRFLWPLFPEASAAFATTGMVIGVVGILYGALMAFAQTDVKRLVAYSSVSHMGFVMLGVFAWNRYALVGALVVMLAHGISTGALFTIVGQMYERLHTRDMDKLGGLWSAAPRMGGTWLFFAAASLGLPGLGNFVGEVLVLVGVFAVSPAIAAVAALGLVASAIYSLWMVQRVLHGPNKNKIQTSDLNAREWAIHATLIAATLWVGLYPQTFINIAMPAFDRMMGHVSATGAGAPSNSNLNDETRMTK